ncbi:peptidase inhibitor family I36 protein [Nonomuraea aridisoli]|uniref:Peptidase inhibitor family I36 protein n=1 Tax=Nonomuraea aridisoli TaxID=2070368 RepID=A0A2W2FEL0_9ACTN|nr:peptidase inhibitor family I36 protein [Nonomuraea aridisoli]PZG20087.1 hypothetical protein C1J01_10435 [Nonomuraea aridisoli]
MQKLRSVIASLGLTALVLLNVTGTAHAEPVLPADSPAASAAAAPDGYFYAWGHINRGGFMCHWSGDDPDWSTCDSVNLRNDASSLENRGWPGPYEDVFLYWDDADDAGGWDHTRACLPNGLYLNNLTGIYYPWDGRQGQGETLNDNISAHRWGSGC